MSGPAGQRKVLVAVSGGVDSAAAACLLLEQGYEVVAAFLCTQRAEGGNPRACCSPQDVADARRVAELLGIKLVTLPVTQQFNWLAASAAREYVRGRTPNMCITCNAKIKIGLLLDLADQVGAAHLATGHYARMLEQGGEAWIARAANRAKDQSYVLMGLDDSQRRRLMLPLGDISDKRIVRQIATKHGLPFAQKAESQDACFMPDGGVEELLRQHGPEGLREGDVLDVQGRVVARHQGYGCYTVGQRRGLGFAAGQRWYVCSVDPERATVTVGPRESLAVSGLSASGAIWHTQTPASFTARVQVRYSSPALAAQVQRLDDGRFDVRFCEPAGPVAPGQAAVIYDEQERVVGGGWIDSTQPTPHEADSGL